MTRRTSLRFLIAIVASIGGVLGQEWAWVQKINDKERFGLDLSRFESFEVKWGDEIIRIPADELWKALNGSLEREK